MSVKDLCATMVKYGASDLYITSGLPPTIKISGKARGLGKNILSGKHTEQLANSIMNERQREAFEDNMEMNLSLNYVKEMDSRFRVNILRQRGDVAIVIRVIPKDIKTCADLNVPPKLEELVMHKRGLILLVGATGSGKSTTLAAMIDHRNRNEAGHIITVEDPLEFVHEHKSSIITQREVGTDTLTFNHALRNMLRQAPDVILVGEIRDLETMEAAITFAETGHLCLSTLHSNNANQAIERIMNFFPQTRHKQIYQQLSLNLRSIISQRLIQTPDGGRIPAVEIMLNTPRISELILLGKVGEIKPAMEQGGHEGLQTFDMALVDLCNEGKISRKQAIA
ncbi:MAG: PilT/PilU family type 4a pilus ATPase, partial [Desulfobacterales bacterium]|nr:PilT/PilU family type 4a pilus ATPase [Desulfobacterales bacterium]